MSIVQGTPANLTPSPPPSGFTPVLVEFPHPSAEPQQPIACYELDHLRGESFAFMILCHMQRMAYGGLNRRIAEAAEQRRALTPEELHAHFYGRAKGIALRTGLYIDTVSSNLALLRKERWIIPVEGKGNLDSARSGTFQPTTYWVLNHGLWTAMNGGGQCCGR